MRKLPQGRPLPPKWRYEIDMPLFGRSLTLLERLQLIIGYNVVVSGKVWCEHSPGKFDKHFILKTTKEHIKKPA